MKIYAIHLLNDYSGSPKVLMQLIKGWVKNGLDVTLSMSKGREGFLSNIDGVTQDSYWYHLKKNPIKRFFNLFLSQFLLFTKLIFKVNKEDIIYINTVLPFGAAIAGRIRGCRIIYHIHETTMKPKLFKDFLFGIVKFTGTDVIYVSKYLSQQEPLKLKNHILYNAIETEYLTLAKNNRKIKNQTKNILMVCSLKVYKGIDEFVNLAKHSKDYSFRLVLNASKEEIQQYFKDDMLFTNLDIYDTQTNLHPFYQWADVIMNLSRPDGWIETFGLTIIEGMSYGLPAIIPPIGGITELVEENINGFLVDSRNGKMLKNRLEKLLTNIDSYRKMADYSKEKIEHFSEEVFIKNSLKIIKKGQI